MSERSIASFIIRVVRQETRDGDEGRWMGLVRHIQSGAEERFVELDQVLAFMERLLATPDEPTH